MKFWKISFLLASTAVMTLSCKKDDGEVNVKYMEGSIKLDVPAFVLPGYSQTFPLDPSPRIRTPSALPKARCSRMNMC